MDSFYFAHLHGTQAASTAHIALFRNVANAANVLQEVKTGDGSAFADMPMALVDARMITSRQHILVAVHQAVLRNARAAQRPTNADGSTTAIGSGMRTKSVHSEVLWMLSLTNNIADSFRTFGLSEQTKDLLLIHIARSNDEGGPSADEVARRMASLAQGDVDERGLDALDEWRDGNEQPAVQSKLTVPIADWAAIVKAYKLSDVRAAVSSLGDEQTVLEANTAQRERIDELTTSLVAMKSVAS